MMLEAREFQFKQMKEKELKFNTERLQEDKHVKSELKKL